MEYWGAEDYGRPQAGAVTFKFKMDTDLYDLAKAKTRACSISFSPDGKNMAVTARDKQVRFELSFLHFCSGLKTKNEGKNDDWHFFF